MARYAILRNDGAGRLYWVTVIGIPAHASDPPPDAAHYGNAHIAAQDAETLAGSTYQVVELTPEAVAEIGRLARGVGTESSETKEPAAG